MTVTALLSESVSRTREAVNLVVAHGLTQCEAAALVGITQGAVRAAMRRPTGTTARIRHAVGWMRADAHHRTEEAAAARFGIPVEALRKARGAL